MSQVQIRAERKCMVLYRRSLLAQGVAHLIRAEQDMTVSLANVEHMDPMEAIRSINPDVLILDMNNLREMGDFLARLLTDRPNMKIVGLHPQKSVIYMLQPRLREVNNAQEFLDILREDA